MVFIVLLENQRRTNKSWLYLVSKAAKEFACRFLKKFEKGREFGSELETISFVS